MQDLFIAIALALVFEGSYYALAPEKAQAMMRELSTLEPDMLRKAGLLIAIVGVLVIVMIKG